MFATAWGSLLSLFLFVISMDKNSKHSWGEEIIKIASQLSGCCCKPENEGMDGLLMLTTLKRL